MGEVKAAGGAGRVRDQGCRRGYERLFFVQRMESLADLPGKLPDMGQGLLVQDQATPRGLGRSPGRDVVDRRPEPAGDDYHVALFGQ